MIFRAVQTIASLAMRKMAALFVLCAALNAKAVSEAAQDIFC
jgi:hypothetical protein